MKIAIFSDTFYPQVNGVSHFAFYSAQALAERGHAVKVFTTISSEDLKSSDFSKFKFQIKNIPSLPSPIYRGQDLRLTIPAGWTLRQLRKFRPDIIHSHTPFAVGMEAILGAKLLKIPLVGEHHTFFDDYLKHVKLDYEWGKKFSWKATVSYYNRCNLVVSPSKALADSLIRFGLKKPSRVIPNSIDTSLFHPLSSGEKEEIKKSYGIEGLSVVYMGRVSYEKSIDVVLRAFSELLKKETIKDVKLMIIGDGPERKNLEKLSRELGIEKNMVWTGMLRGETFARTLASNDIFVTGSKSENMPLSVVEAMACGLPTVMVAERGLAELMRDGVNGYFCRTDDSKDMAQKMRSVLEDGDRRKEFSENSRSLSLNYSKEKIMCLFEDCYKESINNLRQKK